MPELTPQERLQPSLLDRLTDEAPEREQESRDQRVLSIRQYRAAVIRDLAWLLNTASLGATEDLEDFPGVAVSVLNYGIRDLTGTSSAGADTAALERRVREAIWNFEPRILRQTVRVRAKVSEDPSRDHNVLQFEIEGELWAQPMTERLFLKTEIDLETGTVRVSEAVGEG